MLQSKKQIWRITLLMSVLLVLSFMSSISWAQTNAGEDLFKSKCATCHGPDGAGKTTMGTVLKIRDLRSDEVQRQTDADLNRVIAKGKNKMPSFDGKLKKEQIDLLVSYIRELAKKQ